MKNHLKLILILSILNCWANAEEVVTRNTLAIKNATKACEAKNMSACNDVGILLFDDGKKIEAIKYLKMACDAGIMKGCTAQGLVSVQLGNKEEAKKLLTIACNGKENTACDVLLKISQEKAAVQYTAIELEYKKACEAKEKRQCTRLGILEENKGNIQEAARLYKIACDLGEPIACSNLSKLSPANISNQPEHK